MFLQKKGHYLCFGFGHVFITIIIIIYVTICEFVIRVKLLTLKPSLKPLLFFNGFVNININYSRTICGTQ